MSIQSKTRTAAFTLADFAEGDCVALSTAALGNPKLNGIYYARVLKVGTEKLLMRCDALHRDFIMPPAYVSHKMFSAD